VLQSLSSLALPIDSTSDVQAATNNATSTQSIGKHYQRDLCLVMQLMHILMVIQTLPDKLSS
jgi:hypothetical protein